MIPSSESLVSAEEWHLDLSVSYHVPMTGPADEDSLSTPCLVEERHLDLSPSYHVRADDGPGGIQRMRIVCRTHCRPG